MRLLEILPNGDYRLTEELLDNAVPQYAILSHTWGHKSQEMTFEDMTEGKGRDKSGYEKIKFCGERAAKDRLKYFWVDSCCIKKSSDAELSESLNSMFRWYQRAAKCYVYLSDVSTKRKSRDENMQVTWEQSFRKSKWFTRGWTLQELLAPSSIEFFSRECKRLGAKQSLAQQISMTTGIPISALQNSALSQFSIDQKFEWARNRQTTREEDWAYALLGIFKVSMSVIYGEGRSEAVRRLRKEITEASKDRECLQHLFVTDPRLDKIRIEQTKAGLLRDSYNWILEHNDFKQWRGNQHSHLLWIKGDPGKGKTMLLCGIVDELQKLKAETHLLSFFYCQATDSRINSATAVLRGLLYLLIDQQPSLISHVQKRHDHAGKTLFEGANTWITISDIFTNVLQDPSLRETYLIIDALDECTVGQSELLDFITQKSSLLPQVKWLVSSRNWPPIEERLDNAESKVRLCLELNAKSVSAAVGIYIRHRVSRLAQEKKYDEKTEDAILNHLFSNANNTFLWVALVCQNLQTVKPWHVSAKLNDFPPGLDSLYGRMMEQINCSVDADLCKRILATISILYRPVTLKELPSLVDVPESIAQNLNWLVEIIGFCGSFLTTRGDTIYFVHQSAKDYLSGTAYQHIFPHGIAELHFQIHQRSLAVLDKTLRREIYGLQAPGILIEEVPDLRPPLSAVAYSSRFWIDHLCQVDKQTYTEDPQFTTRIQQFLNSHFLHWLEALSLTREAATAIVALRNLENWLTVSAQLHSTE
jgi:NACHT domain/Heterokaryon incompatibility protein (HET)